MSVILACLLVHHMHTVPQKPEISGSPETVVMECCEQPYGSWELNVSLGILQAHLYSTTNVIFDVNNYPIS